MKIRFLNLILAMAVTGLSPANASTYEFNVLYGGHDMATLAAVSDDPLATSLVVGDSFDYRLIAQGLGEWTVLSDTEIFPFFSLPVIEFAERTGDWTLTLSNNGAIVYATSEIASANAYIHMGTNALNLQPGLVFDEIELNYTLTSSTSEFSTPESLLPWPGVGPENNPYVDTPAPLAYAVPEPSTYAMFLAGLLVLGLSLRSQFRGNTRRIMP